MKISKINKSNREYYEKAYLTLPEKISIIYKKNYDIDLSIRVIRRVTLDNVCEAPWETKTILTPAYKHLTITNLKNVVYLFKDVLNPLKLLKLAQYSDRVRDGRDREKHKEIVQLVEKLLIVVNKQKKYE